MATQYLLKSCSKLLLPAANSESLIFTRTKTCRQKPTKIKKNPYVKRFTDFIKHACITLIKYERMQTTLGTAYRLEEYGNMLIAFTQRRRPPPDLFMVKNGFLLDDHEVKKRLTDRVVRNRMVKYVVQEPKELPEEEYVAKCREEAANVLLQDQVALDKLYGELADRYRGIDGHYIKVTPIPYPDKTRNPKMAYVELVNNNKPPLPKLPVLEEGRLKTFPRDTGYHFVNTV